MLTIKCNECSYDLTPLFGFDFSEDKDGLPKRMIVTCPECLTKGKLEPFKRKTGWIVLSVVEKKIRTFHHANNGKVKEITIIGGIDNPVKATQDELDNLHKAKCGRCGVVINLFISFLVKLRGEFFPKVTTNEIHVDPEGNSVVTPVVSYRPPQPLKYRLCKKCFDLYKPSEFIKGSTGVADIELLPDPINKMRDGLKQVPISQSMKASRYEVDIIDKPYQHKGIVYEENIIGLFCREDDYFTQAVFRPVSDLPAESIQVIKKPRPYRPLKAYMRVHPTRHKRLNLNPYPWVDFKTNKERREAFKKRFNNAL